MNWDERGRLWVCETYDYPNELQPEGEGRDRIRILKTPIEMERRTSYSLCRKAKYPNGNRIQSWWSHCSRRHEDNLSERHRWRR